MPKSLFQLREPHCRYPLNDTPPYVFCAREAMKGESYCPQHQELCYGKAAPRVRRMVCHVGFDIVDMAAQETRLLDPPARPAADLVEYAQEPHAHAVVSDMTAESDLHTE